MVLLASGCSGGSSISTPITVIPCILFSSKPEFAYALTGYAVSMYTVDTCTGAFTATTPASIATGYASPQEDAEQMVVDPLSAGLPMWPNLVSNASVPGHYLDVHH